MNIKDNYIVPKEKRIKLGNYIKETRLNSSYRKLGLNELSDITGISNSLISNLENGKIQKINPFLLQDIAKGLEIDYKILYKIIGYLDNDIKLDEKSNYKKKSRIIILEKEKEEIIDISSISKEGISKLKDFIGYLKINYKEYQEFLKWKKEKKREYKIDEFMKSYMEREEWNESSRYQIRYTNESVMKFFEDNGLRLNKDGKQFYEKLINFFGGEDFFEELKDLNGELLTGAKKEYQMGKIVKYYATHVRLDFS